MAGLETMVQLLEHAGLMGDLWVNGSFVTQAINPADSDVAFCVSSEQYDAAAPEVFALLEEWFRPGTAAEAFNCHAFLFCEFPVGHPSYHPGIRDYWLSQYGTGNDEVSPKGIAVVSVGGGSRP